MTRTRKWTLGTALAIVLVLLAGWFLLISPKRSEAAELSAQTEAQMQANDVLRGKIAVLKSQAADLPQQEAELASIRQKLPATPALPGLIRSLSSIAGKSGVVLEAIEPQTPAAKTMTVTAPAPTGSTPVPSTQDTGSTTTATATVESGLMVIPVTIRVTGSYFDIEQFFNKAEDLTRSLLVSGFTMDTADAADEGSSTTDLTAEISARVFYAPVTAPAAATTATAPSAPSANN